jgi:two-component system response regulator HydG
MVTEPKPRVLVVDDNLEMARTIADGLEDHGYDAVALGSGRKALEWLTQNSCDALVTDLRMAGLDGLGLLTASRKQAPERPVIVMTAYSAVDSAIECIRQGAYHYLTKPFLIDELAIFLQRALDETRVRREASALKTTLRERYSRSQLLGNSAPMRALRDLLERIADADTPVLIGGETGTGKGLVARVIHIDSHRASGPFVTVNCAAIPEALLESELFGHERGAFTGALTSRKGLFAEADGGTLFLDEIGDMSLPLQAKLLHVLESQTIRPVGSNKELKIDVRILAATHRDLHLAVQKGSFREDLFYRLDVVVLTLPALRHRREDIPELLAHFLRVQHARHPDSKVEKFSPEALSYLLRYDWPGNVRELAHLVERAVILGREAEVPVNTLPSSMHTQQNSGGPTFEGEVLPMRELQRRYAAWALVQLGGNKRRTAEKLDMDHKTLAKLVAEEEESVPRS